ncbi:hypothetical protein BPOR_0025g00120 [Botrytis porri]|uniref:Uncharacterized protein n=1 Tax=Botrytis porri TaxID=87229 RepID=A0A4Z1L408_9HELO|nr:hypothetical protein BPOR_0025g00120 [Botrytis porri]
MSKLSKASQLNRFPKKSECSDEAFKAIEAEISPYNTTQREEESRIEGPVCDMYEYKQKDI